MEMVIFTGDADLRRRGYKIFRRRRRSARRLNVVGGGDATKNPAAAARSARRRPKVNWGNFDTGETLTLLTVMPVVH